MPPLKSKVCLGLTVIVGKPKEKQNISLSLSLSQRERGRERDPDRESSNSKTLFHKDCSLGSVKICLTTSPY